MMLLHIHSFFARRWNSGVKLRLLLWRDMVGVGTLVNLSTSFVAVTMLIQELPTAYPVLVHLAPLPYNLFLLAAVWRSTERTASAMMIGSIWFALMTIV